MSIDARTYIKEKASLIEPELERLMLNSKWPAKLGNSMKYSLLAGGKRLRPVLTLAACESCGGTVTTALPVACGIELIHTYSLIHDDLPCMDNDDVRRGKPSNHIAFGEDIALLAGDALLALAFSVIAEGLIAGGIKADVALEVILEIARAAGPEGMVGGQVLDLELKDRCSLDDLKAAYERKTGALFRAALKTGGMVANASREALEALDQFGRHFGLAFQITDDILDVIGHPEKTGKDTGRDSKNQKPTFVSLLGVEEAREIAKSEVELAKQRTVSLQKGEVLAAIAEYVISRQE